DGTSNTIMIGEQSDWCRNPDGTTNDCRSDFGHGFSMGGCPWNEWRVFNATTVRYPINEKRWNLIGVNTSDSPPNRALQSAHAAGANVVFADGSVRMLTDRIPAQTLSDMSNRDEGNILNAE